MRLWAFAIAVLVASASVDAAAPRPALSKVLKGEALESYEAARQAFKSQRYQLALSGFVKAYELSKDARLLWNSAACLRKLERNADAMRSIDAYIAESGRELSLSEMDEAMTSRAAVRQLIAVLHVTTAPADAKVSIDGTVVDTSSFQGVYLEPGRHAVVISREGFQDVVREESFVANSTTRWKIALSPVAQESAQPTSPAVVVAPEKNRRWAPWVLAGGGAAVAATGGVLFALSAGEHARLSAECGTRCSPARVQPARSTEAVGVAMLAVGAAALASGIGWWALSGAESSARVALTPVSANVEVRF